MGFVSAVVILKEWDREELSVQHGGDIYRNKVELDFSVSLNPVSPPEAVAAALKESMGHVSCYPDLLQTEVRQAIAASDGVTAEEVLAGNGASELLSAVVAYLHPHQVTLLEPGFSGYHHALRQWEDCKIREVTMEASTDPAGQLFSILWEGVETEVLFLANPWNPLGVNLEDTLLMQTLSRAERQGTPMILDESFFWLSDAAERVPSKAGTWIRQFPNLFIIRSYTKIFSMPGVRMGYLLSQPDNCKKVQKKLPEWNLSIQAQELMPVCARILGEGSFLRETMAYIKRERSFLQKELTERGFLVYPGDTVFLLFRGPETLFELLLKKKIMIRPVQNGQKQNRTLYRIAIKDHESNLRLLHCLDEVQKNDRTDTGRN
ncbi:MAG: aminotransferase class I/II-fold pyridoxal phosphate-dependent enzyme [Lachnospiraceae bacterium]|nr:aminotransferase class I/II-fold pyridoxal phosphate-dependent enzyme [Lachnospiraceae bacterium]